MANRLINNWAQLVAIAAVCLSALLIGQSTLRWLANPTAESLLKEVKVHDLLAQVTDPSLSGSKEVRKVTDGIHIAMGFSLGNSILIEAPDGLIIVDTTECLKAARQIHQAFRRISSKPVKAIIYTHHHLDHVNGAQAFVEDPESPPQIWAHEKFLGEREKTSTVGEISFKRSVRQFGIRLPESVKRGLKLHLGEGDSMGFIEPTHFLIGQEQNVTIAGLEMRFLHIPGETDDHLGIWIPHQRALLCADDIYRAFPNMYAVRGTAPRDAMAWIRSLDKMRNLRPNYLIPSHTSPREGQQTIYDLLTDYRDAMQLVHDQTVRHMNKGLLPDDIVKKVKLPDTFKNSEYLEQLYGTVEWSVKGVFNTYVGWFSGDIVDMCPLTYEERSHRMVELVGETTLAAAARKALRAGDLKWALELASHILRVNPSHSLALDTRLGALKGLSTAQSSGNGRNYYLTLALEDHGLIENKLPESLTTKIISQASIPKLFRAMALRLKAEECEGEDIKVVFNFTDVGQVYTLHLRHSILDVSDQEASDWTLRATLTDQVFRQLLTRQRSALNTYFTGNIQIEGGVLEFRRFLSFIDKE